MSNSPLKAVCRDCGHMLDGAAAQCPTCRHGRLVRHPEIESLAIAHVDCDAFFASVEKRDNLQLRDKPVIVGGGERGVVSTCCYIARAFGIRSAMPMFKARALCPHAVVVKPQYDKYVTASQQIRAAMERLTPLVQPISIDEAFLDLSGTERLHAAPPAVTLARLAREVEAEVNITISIGLSHNKMLAKIASDLEKPRGFAVIGRAETVAFLAEQPTRMMMGVGPKAAARLARDGFQTLGDLQRADPKRLITLYGEQGWHLHRRVHGHDDRPVRVERETKSVSGETTFRTDLTDPQALEDHLYAMAQKVSRRAKAKGVAGRVVTLKLKTAGFRQFTRRKALPHATNLAHMIFETARGLLAQESDGTAAPIAYRLIGVGISELTTADAMDADFLFADSHRKIGAREEAVAALRDKFGEDAIGTGRDMRIRPPKPKKDLP